MTANEKVGPRGPGRLQALHFPQGPSRTPGAGGLCAELFFPTVGGNCLIAFFFFRLKRKREGEKVRVKERKKGPPKKLMEQVLIQCF